MTYEISPSRFLSYRRAKPTLAMENIALWTARDNQRAQLQAERDALTRYLKMMDDVWKRCGI